MSGGVCTPSQSHPNQKFGKIISTLDDLRYAEFHAGVSMVKPGGGLTGEYYEHCKESDRLYMSVVNQILALAGGSQGND